MSKEGYMIPGTGGSSQGAKVDCPIGFWIVSWLHGCRWRLRSWQNSSTAGRGTEHTKPPQAGVSVVSWWELCACKDQCVGSCAGPPLGAGRAGSLQPGQELA